MTNTRRVGQFHVKPWETWLLILVSMTFLMMWLAIFLLTSAQPSSDEPGQVPHFVCTADGDGTILRCAFSSIAQPPISRSH